MCRTASTCALGKTRKKTEIPQVDVRNDTAGHAGSPNIGRDSLSCSARALNERKSDVRYSFGAYPLQKLPTLSKVTSGGDSEMSADVFLGSESRVVADPKHRGYRTTKAGITVETVPEALPEIAEEHPDVTASFPCRCRWDCAPSACTLTGWERSREHRGCTGWSCRTSSARWPTNSRARCQMWS